LFIDSVVEHMKIELAQECDYVREAECCRKMRKLLEPFPEFYVPRVIDELSTKQVFTTELISGLTIDEVRLIMTSHTFTIGT
jgi:aarF domain-containing kinase